MAEIQLTKIRSIYGDIKGLLSQIPLSDKSAQVSGFIVNGFNSTIDELSKITDTDYSRYRVTHEAQFPRTKYSLGVEYWSTSVRAQIGRIISRLEEEYGFGKENNSKLSPSFVIVNKNENEISLQINYTLNDLIEKAGDEESKEQLKELKDELNKENKNWEKIKDIIIWILNFSKDLFLQILPIILEKRL